MNADAIGHERGDAVTIRHRGEYVIGTVVRYNPGGKSGWNSASYVVSVPGEPRSVWLRPDEIVGRVSAYAARVRPSGYRQSAIGAWLDDRDAE